ncbi:hypothetical protein Y032_0123g1172 [Ancylostoma ceylanicum]|uniref:Uncharacterized protein n=1 Tax=Ancylostoma ceylanicum TaxID=53326 RepID=A0A016T9S9_9BILA|nr:hypothetical protein Y032_0123g1172 [Ancylostoma ceylanicum]
MAEDRPSCLLRHTMNSRGHPDPNVCNRHAIQSRGRWVAPWLAKATWAPRSSLATASRGGCATISATADIWIMVTTRIRGATDQLDTVAVGWCFPSFASCLCLHSEICE